MEPSGTVILEPCDNSSMIIRSVKGIVYTTSANIGVIERNSVNNKFLVLTNTSEFNNDNEVTILETTDTTNADSINHSKNSSKCLELCRICANSSDHMISIFEDEGAQHDLCSKIHKYLPIRITENDTLPLQVCFHCASTLLAWHDLAEGCLNSEQKLIQIQNELNSQEDEKLISTIPEPVEPDNVKSIEKEITNLIELHTLPEPIVEEKINANEKQDTVNDERSCNVSTEFDVFVDVQNKSSSITTNTSDVTNDQHIKGSWATDNDEINLDYNDVTESQSIHHNIQESDLTKSSIDIKGKCSICSVGFSDIKSLHLHVKTHKLWSSQESYQCAECNKCFKLKDSLVRHLRIHNNERSFTCHVCGKQFRDSGGLSRHLNDVHAKRKPFFCDICNKNFASNATRNDHRRTHTGERPYVCNSCGKKFKSKACLYIHSKVHTNSFPHPCLLCNKKFRRRQELLCHTTTHTGEKNFICDICEKRFRIKSELARHTRTHSDEKPFICNKCGLRFRQRRYLNNHIKGRHSQFNSCQLIVRTDH